MAKAKLAEVMIDPQAPLLNEGAVIGSNQPPAELSPYERAKKRIEDLYEEAKLWLDGAVVDNTDLADGIKNLRDEIKKAHTDADDARKAENKAFDDGKTEVQDRYNLLIGKTTKITGLTVKALAAIEKALEPWLRAEEDRLKAEAAEARRIADEALAKAQEALRASDPSNLTEREAAEELVGEAKQADRDANRAANTTAKVSGNFGNRAISLRKVYTAKLNEPSDDPKIPHPAVLAIRHFCKTRPRDVYDFLQKMADDHVRFGDHNTDEIPGFTITMERKL